MAVRRSERTFRIDNAWLTNPCHARGSSARHTRNQQKMAVTDEPNVLIPNPTPDDLPDGGLRAALAHWLDAKGGADLPPQAAIDPLRLPRMLLPHYCIMVFEEPDLRIRIKLVGTAIRQAVGENATGRFTDEIPGTERMTERLHKCRTMRQPYFSRSRMTWSPNDYKHVSALILPFAAPDGAVHRILTYSEFD
jgi:hypothetical protein